MLRDRRREREVFDQLLAAVRAGEARALVVRGEPGVGKTALLEYVAERATGCRVARGSGVESEMELGFAGLHQLCAPLLGRVERLPGPQRDALSTALGLTSGPAPDRFLVGLAVLGLLTEVAGERPLVCLIDDAQWFDQASLQALAFAARRLLAESVALIFTMRESDDAPDLTNLPAMTVTGLPDDDARMLLRSAGGPVDDQLLNRIVAETRGNPQALLEVRRRFTPTVANRFGRPRASPLTDRLERSYRRQVAPLPAGTRRLLLTAAAERFGDPVLVWRAAERLGISEAAAAPAVAAGLIEIDARVRFRHPLMRSAIYRAAAPGERRSAHQALAAVIDRERDPDLRAWHAAQAANGPDEDVAAELERLAGRAQRRAGIAAAAAFLARATELTPEPARRRARALAAAQAEMDAGALDAASGLLATAELGPPLDELQRARLERTRARIAFARNRGRDALPLLLGAAERLAPLDARSARETYLEALAAAIFAGRASSGPGVVEIARAARGAPRPPGPARAIDRLLDGLATRYAEGYAAGLPVLQRALREFRQDLGPDGDEVRWLWLACLVAQDICDDEAWPALASRQVRLAREVGALTVLPVALTSGAAVHLLAGELSAASALIEEADAITQATRGPSLGATALMLAAWRGWEAETLRLSEASVREATGRGEGRGITWGDYASAVLFNGLCRYPAALDAARQASAHDDLGVVTWALVELVEAGARSGLLALAADALRRLGERARASGTEWALGLEARSRALVTEGQPAEKLYQDAIARLTRCRITVHLARAHLVYGEWLRRQGRRVDAREQLRTAHEMFTGMGIEAFAQRAARELMASGGKGHLNPTAETGSGRVLTDQETQIARLAVEGLSNSEIGARLFISPRTVEWHLHKIFTKLNVTSRRQLRG